MLPEFKYTKTMNKARFLLVTIVALFISMQAFADIQNNNEGSVQNEVSCALGTAVYSDSVWSVMVNISGLYDQKVTYKCGPNECPFQGRFYNGEYTLIKVGSKGKVGLIKADSLGTVVIPVKYNAIDKLGSYPCDLFTVEVDGKSSLYSTTQKKTLLPFDEYNIWCVFEGVDDDHHIYAVENANGKMALFKESGRKIADFGVFTSVKKCMYELIIVEKNGKYGAITYSGRVAIPAKHDLFEDRGPNGNYLFTDHLSNGTGNRGSVYSGKGVLLTTKVIYNNQSYTLLSFLQKWMGY
jgi:hypothetical protein